MRPEELLPMQDHPYTDPQLQQPQRMPYEVQILQPSRGAPETRGSAQPPGPLPADPDSRMAAWRSLLTNFVWSLGQGMSNKNKGPGAGVGAAILGPWTLEMERNKMALEREKMELAAAQEERTRAASAEAMNRIAQSNQRLPAELERILAQANASRSTADVNAARVPQIQAQTQGTQATTGLTTARTGLVNAQTTTEQQRPDLMQSQAELNRARVVDILEGRVDPLSPEGIDAQVELARRRAPYLQNQGQGNSTLYERLGDAAYMDYLSRAAQARQGVDASAIQSYTQGIMSGNLTNLSQVPQTARAKVLEALGAAGGFVITPSDREAIRKLDMAGYLVDQLEFYSRRVSADPTDVESLSMLYGLRQAVSGVFAKGVFAEVGVLTDADIKRVQAIIPGIVRSAFLPGTSENQFGEMRGIINKAKTGFQRPVGTILGTTGAPATSTPTATPAAPAPTTGPVPDFIIRGGRLIPNPARVP